MILSVASEQGSQNVSPDIFRISTDPLKGTFGFRPTSDSLRRFMGGIINDKQLEEEYRQALRVSYLLYPNIWKKVLSRPRVHIVKNPLSDKLGEASLERVLANALNRAGAKFNITVTRKPVGV